MNELALFAGAGGGILGGKLLGWRTVCAVELDAYAASVLAARQNEGILPPFPIWDDVCTFNGKLWKGHVEVVSGGFPCQDISCAGKGVGITGERSRLWIEMARIVAEVRPRFVFIENSDQLVNRGLDVVLRDLTALGYDARWTVLSAADVGAPHIRKRLWILAYSDRAYGAGIGQPSAATAQHAGIADRGAAFSNAGGLRPEQPGRSESERASQTCLEERGGDVADTARIQPGREEQRPERERVGPSGESIPMADTVGERCDQVVEPIASGKIVKTKLGSADHRGIARGRRWWHLEPNVGRVAHGVAARVDRLRVLGNGQVPLCAATAFRLLVGDLT